MTDAVGGAAAAMAPNTLPVVKANSNLLLPNVTDDVSVTSIT
jgi:hypothetical protein